MIGLSIPSNKNAIDITLRPLGVSTGNIECLYSSFLDSMNANFSSSVLKFLPSNPDSVISLNTLN